MPGNKDRLTVGLNTGNIKPDLKSYKRAPKEYPISTQIENGPETTQESKNALTQESENALSQDGTNALLDYETNANSQNEENALSQKGDNAKSQSPASERKSQGFKLKTSLIKSLKRIALEEDRHLYDVMEDAIEEYIQRYRVKKGI